MKHIILVLLFLLGFARLYCQVSNAKEMTVRAVYAKIVEAYDDPRTQPDLRIIPNTAKEKVIARYASQPDKIIEIDEKLVDICLGLKADSLNALAIILSHELAHFYRNHSFCIDYQYAAGKKSAVKKRLSDMQLLPAEKFKMEAQADDEGIWHAAIAGFDPFYIFPAMIDRIYHDYKLNDVLPGYPSIRERKGINKTAQEDANKLLPVFQAGLMLFKMNMYEEAASCFDEVTKYFPSRENFNNAGVARLSAALNLKSPDRIDFIYPMEPDPVSRLQNNTVRGITQRRDKITSLLAKAKKSFSDAIHLDPAYSIAYINMACFYDIEQSNLDGAISSLNQIPVTDTAKYADKINLVKAITYYHEQNKINSAEYFKKLFYRNDPIINYNLKLFQYSDDLDDGALDKFKQDWKNQNDPNHSNANEEQKIYLNNHQLRNKKSYEIRNESRITITSNEELNTITISVDDKPKLEATKYNNTNDWIIKMSDSRIKENKANEKQWAVIRL